MDSTPLFQGEREPEELAALISGETFPPAQILPSTRKGIPAVMVTFLCQLGYWFPVVWSNTSLDVAVRVFLRCDLTFKSVDFE